MSTRIRTLLAGLGAAVLLGSCGSEPTGPATRMGRLALAPVFANAEEAAIVQVSFVRVRINESLRTDAVLDTVIAWPATGDSLIVTLALPVTATPYALRLAMANAQGDTVFRAGPIPVRATFNPRREDAAAPVLTYIGVGANATGVRFVNPPASALFGATVPIVAEAFDGQNTVIAGTPIAFSLVNPADSVRARFPDRGIGSLVVGTQRGTVAVQARLLTGPSVTTNIAIQPVANGIIAQSGNAQTGVAGGVLAQPLVARVRAADGLGVQGVPVTFAVLTGGGTLSVLTDTSDLNGDVSSTLTLGALIGAQTVRASVPSVPGAEVTFTATATGGAAARLLILDEPTNVTAGNAVAPAVRVAVQDAGGNTLPAAVNPVTVEILNNPGGTGVLQGPLTVNAVAGVATFNAIRIDQAAAGYTLRFTAAGLSADTSVAFTVAPAAATALAFATQPPLSAVNATPFTVAVRARDAFGNTTPVFVGGVTVAIGTNPAAGTLAGTVTQTAVAGVATFTSLSINNIGVGYTLTATGGGLTAATSNAFDITASAGINSWVNAAGGAWSTAANWSQGSVPDPSDTVTIELPGTYTVTVDQNVTVGRLRLGGASGTQTLAIGTNTFTMAESVFVAPQGVVALSGSSLNGIGTMRVAGTFNWTGGAIAGVGGDVVVATGGVLNATGALARNLQERTLRIVGTATWSASGTLNVGLGALLHIAPGGSLAVTSDPSFTFNLGGATPRLHNEGTLTRSGSAGIFLLQMPWENDGTTVLTSGQLTATNGSGAGSSGGALQLGAGTTLLINNGTYNWDAGSSTSGTGTLTVSAGTVNVSSPFAHPGPVTVAGGDLNLLGATNSITGLTISGGNLGGAAGTTVTLNGTTAWTGGSIGTSGIVTVPLGATLNVSNAVAHTLSSATLQIAGTANFTDAFTLNTGLGAVLRVQAGGALNLQGDHILSYNLGGASSRLENLGTITRVSGTGFSTISLPVDHDGVWNVQTGAQRINLGSDVESWSGSMALAAGTTLDFSGGTTALGPTATITGTGALSVAGGTVNVAAPLSFTGAVNVANGALNLNGATALTTVTLSGGSIGGTGAISVATALNWSGGNIDGSGTLSVPVGATLASSGTATRSHSGRLISVGGSANFTGGHQVNSGLGSVLRVLAGGTLLVQGNHSFLNNLGGAAPLVENLGTFTRNTATGTVTMNVPFQNSGTVTLSTGVLDLTGAATLGGPIALATTTTLRLNGGTITLAPTLVVSGLGVTQLAGGIVSGLVAGDTANFGRLQLTGGTLSAGGVVRSTDFLDWAGSTISGTLTLVAVDSMVITTTGTRNLSNATLETRGATVWATAATINSGAGAVWRNAAGANIVWSGNGSLLHNLGGTQTQLENLGGMQFTGAGTATIGATLIDTAGVGFSVPSGTVALSGGGRLSGNRNVTGFLDVTGGVLTLRPGTSISSMGTGTLRMTGGTLRPDSGASVSVDRFELSGGALDHEGTFSVTTLFNWSAGSIQSNQVGLGGTTALTTGATMNITGATARSASGTHLLSITPGTTVNHNATGAILTGLGFTVQNGGTYNLQNVGGYAFTLGGTQPTFRNLAGATLTSSGASTGSIAMRMDNQGGALTVTGDTLRLLLGSTGSFAGTATVNTAALKLGGGPFTLTGAFTVAGTAGDLVVNNGSIAVGTQTLQVNGDLLTETGGALTSTAATGVIDVNGNAVFNGAQSVLSAGTLRVAGNFTQGPTGVVNTFDASGTHRTVFDGTGPQSITFANPTSSRFNRVEFPTIGHTVTLQTNVTVLDSLIMLGGGPGSADLVGAGTTQRLRVEGVLRMDFSTTSPSLSVPVVEMTAVPAVAAISSPGRGFFPDTAVYLGAAITALPTNAGYKYNSVRLATGAAVTIASDTIAGDLHVSSGVASYVGTVNHRIQGDLRTTGTGSIFLFSVDANVTVVDSAIFGGASTNTTLNAGTLRLLGHFVQAGGNTAAFAATGTHTTIFAGAAQQTIRFDNPGTTTTTSHFAELQIANVSAGGVRLLSPVHAVTQLETSFSRTAISQVSSANGDSLTIQGANADSITFDNTPLRVIGTGAITKLNVIRFQNMAATATQFRFTRAGTGTPIALNDWTFASTPVGGLYFSFNNTAVGVAMPVNFLGATPGTIGALGGLYQRLGATLPAVNWNGQPMP